MINTVISTTMRTENEIPRQVVEGSVLLQLASAYLSIGKKLEQKTKCSQTRGFVLSTLRGGATLNQNQIATLLGFDRTVVHRSIKTMIRDGLLSEKKAPSGRALLVHLTAKGNSYRELLINERRAVDEKLRKKLKPREISTLLRLLPQIAALDL
jgi:DNA-binding MarR family transcriptional regulator